MLCKAKIRFLSHGKHNNLHFKLGIGGTRRNPLFLLKMVVFFDTNIAYILHSNLHPHYAELIDFNQLTKVIQDELDKHDYNLKTFGKQDLLNKRLKSVQILDKLKYKFNFKK